MQQWKKRILFGALLLGAFVFGVWTTRVAVLSSPCENSPSTVTVVSTTVQSPVLYGIASGMLMGFWPQGGYGQIDSCIVGDFGVGMPLAAFETIRGSAAYAWAVARGVGFAVDGALALWVLSWLLRAVQTLRPGQR